MRGRENTVNLTSFHVNRAAAFKGLDRNPVPYSHEQWIFRDLRVCILSVFCLFVGAGLQVCFKVETAVSLSLKDDNSESLVSGVDFFLLRIDTAKLSRVEECCLAWGAQWSGKRCG